MKDNSKVNLEELQTKYDLLKHKLDTQEIVDPEMIFSISRAKMQKLQDRYRTNTFFSLIFLPFIALMMAFRDWAAPWFCICYGLFGVGISLYWLWCYKKKLSKTTTTDDLLSTAKSYKELYKANKVQKWVIAPLAILLLVCLEVQFGHLSLSGGKVSMDFSEIIFLGLFFLFMILYGRFRKKKDSDVCDEIIQSLGAAEEESK